jgi:nucleotide-binding universal stress UspA family protein
VERHDDPHYHVLCPVDFSEIRSMRSIMLQPSLVGHEARLTLLYVFANLPTMDLPPLVLEDADRERLLSDLRRMAAAVPRDVPVEFSIQEAGFVHEEILSQLGATHADLLVLGTHGRSGFQRLFLGSVTEKVIRKTTCPTLVVPPRAPDVPAGSPIQFRRTLCAVDFSESSLDALAYAINVAEEADAQLTLLHVVELPPVLFEEPTMRALDLSRVREAAAADARRRLHELIPDRPTLTAPWTRPSSKVERIARYFGRPPSGSRI